MLYFLPKCILPLHSIDISFTSFPCQSISMYILIYLVRIFSWFHAIFGVKTAFIGCLHPSNHLFQRISAGAGYAYHIINRIIVLRRNLMAFRASPKYIRLSEGQTFPLHSLKHLPQSVHACTCSRCSEQCHTAWYIRCQKVFRRTQLHVAGFFLSLQQPS